jgi:hypothetical protein
MKTHKRKSHVRVMKTKKNGSIRTKRVRIKETKVRKK